MRIFSLLIVNVLLIGCSTVTPKENFINFQSSLVGKKWNELPNYHVPNDKDPLSSEILPNGNIKNKYKGLGTCILIYEINITNNTIADASSEGKCGIPP